MDFEEEAALIFQEDYATFLEDQVWWLRMHEGRIPAPQAVLEGFSPSCSSGLSCKRAGGESIFSSSHGALTRSSTMSTHSGMSAISTTCSLSSYWDPTGGCSPTRQDTPTPPPKPARWDDGTGDPFEPSDISS